MNKDSKRRKRIILITGSIIAVITMATVIFLRTTIFKPIIKQQETVVIYIKPSTSYEEIVKEILNNTDIHSEKLFRLVAKKMKYPNNIKTGKYIIKEGSTMIDLLRILRSGNQTPVKLTFNNIRTKENLAGRISQQLMIDSVSILSALNNKELVDKLGFDSSTIVAMFIPNTYEVYWDLSVDKFINRMYKEYETFWNANRKNKAEIIGLTPLQVSTLASIVEEEAIYSDEYPIVAGLYLNRLRRGQRLEADPTIKFALQDFSLRRILFKHLEVESPYNTYKNDGLPPGPIRVPSISAIDATLSPHKHNYLFMCAKDDFSGRHNFATTHAEHIRNAAKYQRALNQRKIY